MSEINTAGLIAKRRYARHRVAQLHFVRGQSSDAAPLDCTCGWSGSVGQWGAHRGPDLGPRGHVSVSRAATELEQFERVH